MRRLVGRGVTRDEPGAGVCRGTGVTRDDERLPGAGVTRDDGRLPGTGVVRRSLVLRSDRGLGV